MVELGLSAIQAGWWMKHALEISGEIVFYPSPPFQTILSSFKEGQMLSSACGSGNWLPNNVQVEILGCTSASPSEAKGKCLDLVVARLHGLHDWSRRVYFSCVLQNKLLAVFPVVLNTDQSTVLVCIWFKFEPSWLLFKDKTIQDHNYC